MPDVLRNILAFVAGAIVGAVVNMALVTLGPSIVPPPAGVDMTSTEGLVKAMPLLEPRHFVMPFLAHALGTFAGALTAYVVAATHREPIAWGIGAFFLLGGISASVMIPAPAWFIALDLLLAYLPMAWLAIRTGARLRARATP